MEIKITVKNKIARLQEPAVIICGNSDYIVSFSFDAEWDAHTTKTARFYHSGGFTDVVFNGNKCNAPILKKATGVYIGVYAGAMHTTTPAYVRCQESIACYGGVPDEPEADVYAQLIALLNATPTVFKTINGIPLSFFVGEQAEYNSLPVADKKHLFAIITDDKAKEELEKQISQKENKIDVGLLQAVLEGICKVTLDKKHEEVNSLLADLLGKL